MPAPASRDHRAAALLLVHAAMVVMAVVYGFDYALPPAWRVLAFRAATLAVLACLLGALWLATRSAWHPRDWSRLAVVLAGGEWALSVFFALPGRLAPFAILGLAAALAALWRWRGAGAALAAVVALGFLGYGVGIALVPIDPLRADMLPFIARAIDLWRGGVDPYTADFTTINVNPFLYLPLQWVAFMPARLLGLDLRVINLLSAAAMLGLVEWRARRGQPELRAAVYPVMLSPLLLPMMHSGQVWPYWLAILGWALLLLSGRWVWAGAAAGLAIGIRQTGLIAAAAMLAGLAGRLRARSWLAAAAAGAAVLAASIAAFVPTLAALRAMLVEGPARAIAMAPAMHNPDHQVAISNLLLGLGLARYDLAAETLIGLCAALIAWRAGRSGLRPVLVVAGLGYALAVSANPYLFRYYYIAGLLLACIGLTAEREPAR